MNLDFFAVMSSLISLFSLIAVGFAAVRFGVLSDKVSASFSALILKITLPCTIFISLVQREYDPKFVHDSMIMMISGIIVFVTCLYSCKYVAKILGVPRNSQGLWAFASTFSNSGFMGFPIALALFGTEGLALSVILNVAFNIVIYTLGAIEISKDNINSSSQKLDLKSIIFSKINIAIILSLIFYFGQINLPKILETPLTYLSNITTPLSMFVIGMALSSSKGLEMFTDKYVWECTAMRLVIIPLVLLGIFRVFPLGDNPLIGAVFVVIMAMPPASVTTVLTEVYKGNVQFAAKIMFVQNLLCIVTIPLICLLI